MQRTRVVIVVLAVAAIGLVGAFYQRRSAVLLQVRVDAVPAEIGIPGIHKMYRGVLTNAGNGRAAVRVCDSLTDAFGREVHVAHAIERWNDLSGRWEEFWRIPREAFCRPYPTGIVEGRVTEIALSAGHSVETSDIAIQASEGLRLGDRLRFVVFPYFDHESTRITSAAFEIDELPTPWNSSSSPQ